MSRVQNGKITDHWGVGNLLSHKGDLPGIAASYLYETGWAAAVIGCLITGASKQRSFEMTAFTAFASLIWWSTR